MFTTVASHPTSRWHANDAQATRAMVLTTLSIAAILAAVLLARRDVAIVKLAQAAITEIISIRIDDDLAGAIAQQQAEAAKPARAAAATPDASALPTRAVAEVESTTTNTATMSTTTVGSPDGVENGVSDGSANGTDTGTPDGTATQPDGTGLGTGEGDGSDEFMAVEKDPAFSLADLYRTLRYPDMARRAGVEGTVLVKVLVGKSGQVEQLGVMASDNAMLTTAALDAVRRLRFTPAEQQGEPVACWVRIPVRFELR